uniref:Uncharacterized protein n=1 Tax=Peronospora matthiolae TaxID=2874970 RepID=A0AAV1U9J8_9STRA
MEPLDAVDTIQEKPLETLKNRLKELVILLGPEYAELLV